MKQQASFREETEVGSIYLVPTPIGNLEDMTFRAIRTLKEADMIAAEDTRQSKKLCNHFDITTPLVRYDEHNKDKAGHMLIEKVKEGKSVALVSDAGMPAISDPGHDIVKLAITEEIAVIALPGANAALTSLVASGLNTEQFYFAGFLPRQKKHRYEALEELKSMRATLMFYEAPHRLKETIEALFTAFGNRRISICRELTKKFEEYQRGTLEEALVWCENGMVKGEFCLIVEGATEDIEEEKWWDNLELTQHVEHYIALGMTSKAAIKQVSTDRNLQKREVYQAYHQ
ncbi:16S rRNA (cytidine(1402)-2'-O)-methyltransferase [Alkalihalophilus lindianensis]|uniref:Ribosomal RNA small subunit methyltransferase I n=1 Tax=Alkalihalophilus lindianensis TaxID=1630542 RepID=A0ABU3XFS6_9BACI|nr:16S rRNA (cytidine(1402)-2'-O)-methyltransferase [Alkalihalophilus lindianensis]MDV2686736.1 16S rRNA (cytidine(1402)-2'-O)-methyltransferase [Alkalihalophilus lindianensis]